MENKSIEDKGITEELIEDIIREAKILLNISDKEEVEDNTSNELTEDTNNE